MIRKMQWEEGAVGICLENTLIRGGTTEVGNSEVGIHERTFTIYGSKSVLCDIETSQRIDSSDIREFRDRKVLPGRKGLATDLGFILKRMQARDDSRVVLVWWCGLHTFSPLPRSSI